MTTEHDDLETLPEDLLCDQALQGLHDADRERLESLLTAPDESLERTAAAVAVVLERAAGLAPLPGHLAARLLRDAKPFVEPPIMLPPVAFHRERRAASAWQPGRAGSLRPPRRSPWPSVASRPTDERIPTPPIRQATPRRP